MELATDEIAPGVTRVKLSGSYNIAGAERVDLMMNVLAGSRSNLLVDMADVSFLSSMGIRSLLSVAKTIARRGGKIVLLQPSPQVAKILVITGTQTLLPVRDDLAEALALLRE